MGDTSYGTAVVGDFAMTLIVIGVGGSSFNVLAVQRRLATVEYHELYPGGGITFLARLCSV